MRSFHAIRNPTSSSSLAPIEGIQAVEKDTECFTVEDVNLPIGYYFGISAATGDLSDAHNIHSIRTFEIDVPLSAQELVRDPSRIEPSAGHAAPPRGFPPNSRNPHCGLVGAGDPVVFSCARRHI
ncbi:hypothetical protein AHF37_05551 [Paragonimus kellicotti]|nr:hypothetical protein AHF37_05551 [Paragonimus kellicotti]